MKKRIVFLFTVYLVAFFSYIDAYAADINISAASAILVCAQTGEVLYSKNAHDKRSMASTTKIMTSLLAIEAATPEREITVSPEMVQIEGTSMGLSAGDSVSLEELVYGMLLQSGNDAANTVAYVLGGSPEEFSVLMNERAERIGMKNTNFVTASGLDDDKHYSTAYDMSLLACECINNPEFVYICSQKKASLTYGNPPYLRTLTNHNRLLWSLDDCIGIKTGFTKKSGRCLVSAVCRNGVTLVAVTLGAPDDWNDHIAMYEYGFSEYKSEELVCDLSSFRVDVAGGTKSSVSIEALGNAVSFNDEGCKVRLLIKPMLYAPVSKGDIVGKALVMTDNDRIIKEISVVAAESVDFKKLNADEISDKNPFSIIIQKIKDFFSFQR